MKSKDWKNITIKQLAAVVADRFEENNIHAVLVGGACVSIYSENQYMSYDLDYVTYDSLKIITPVLEKIGFKQAAKNRFVNKDCKFFIEFVSPPVGIGKQVPIKNFNEIICGKGKIILFTSTDCVKDRLAAYYHWNDPQSLKQAVLVAKTQKVDINDIKKWSKREGKTSEFNEFLNLINTNKRSNYAD